MCQVSAPWSTLCSEPARGSRAHHPHRPVSTSTRPTSLLAPLGVAVALALAVSGCSDDGSGAAVRDVARSVVVIESQRCRAPNVARGVGIVVGDDIVLTAGHTVEGDLRELTVDGQPAHVVLVDDNADLALLSTTLLPERQRVDDLPLSAGSPRRLVLIGPAGPRDVHVDSRETLEFEHHTDRATYRRDVVVFTPGVDEGSSGSPLVDENGRLAGIVILNDDATDQGIAVTPSDIAALLDAGASADEQASPGSC